MNDFYPYTRQHAPSSGLFSNVDDMLRFAQVHLNHGRLGDAQILPAAAYDELWTPDKVADYGLGWQVHDAGYVIVGHGGPCIGFGSSLWLAPDRGVAVVVLANQNPHDQVGPFGFDLLAMLH